MPWLTQAPMAPLKCRNNASVYRLIPASSSFLRSLDNDGASSAIDGKAHPGGNALGGPWYADDRRDAVLTGHDSAMRHGAAHLHHQAASSEEERRPARIGGRRDQADDVDAVRSACDAAASLGVPVARKENGNGSIK